MQSKTTTVFAQLCNMLPREALINLANEKIIVTDGRQVNAQKYNVWDLLCALIFCHLGRCTSLCGIEDGLLTAQKELHHARQARYLKRSTLSYVNSRVGFRILEIQTPPCFGMSAGGFPLNPRSNRQFPPKLPLVAPTASP